MDATESTRHDGKSGGPACLTRMRSVVSAAILPILSCAWIATPRDAPADEGVGAERASQALPASAAQVAPGVIRPGSTADEAGMTQRPTGIDAEFVDKAGMIGKVERQASQLALDRSSNPEVKAFARRMVDDHGRIAGELRRLGAAKGVPVQSRMLVDPAVTALRTQDGHAFDTAYVAVAGPRAHEAAIRLYEGEARNGRDPQLRAFAANALPMLNAHLAAARQLARTVAAAH